MEKRPAGDEFAQASFDRSECRGTEVRDQTEDRVILPAVQYGYNSRYVGHWTVKSVFRF